MRKIRPVFLSLLLLAVTMQAQTARKFTLDLTPD